MTIVSFKRNCHSNMIFLNNRTYVPISLYICGTIIPINKIIAHKNEKIRKQSSSSNRRL